jgi:hypothetical protein
MLAVWRVVAVAEHGNIYQVRRRCILPYLGVDAGEVDPFVEPMSDPFVAGVSNEVGEAVDILHHGRNSHAGSAVPPVIEARQKNPIPTPPPGITQPPVNETRTDEPSEARQQNGEQEKELHPMPSFGAR